MIMSARNFSYGRDKHFEKIIECLPNINKNRFGYRLDNELPPLSANKSNLLNRNLNISYEIQPYDRSQTERTATPFSDLFSGSETGTPDFRSEESDSSAGSVLQRNTAEASRILTEEWERIERTLYNEEGEKCTRPQIIEECKQWSQIHPHLRIIGKAIPLPERRLSYKHLEQEEVIAMHYNGYEEFSESEERLSQSSTDVTPQNSPRVSISDDLCEPNSLQDKFPLFTTYNKEQDLPDMFCSLLQITPIPIHSPIHRKRQNTSILRSEIVSSRWMRNSRPESSFNCDRNSAKSFVSLDTRNYNVALSASERNRIVNSRIITARNRDLDKLLTAPESLQSDVCKISNGFGMERTNQCNVRKVSLPPLLLEEEKKKVSVSSAKKYNTKLRKNSKTLYPLDRIVKHN